MPTNLLVWFPWLRLFGNGDSEKGGMIDCSTSIGRSRMIIRVINEQGTWLVQMMCYYSYFLSINTDKILQKVVWLYNSFVNITEHVCTRNSTIWIQIGEFLRAL